MLLARVLLVRGASAHNRACIGRGMPNAGVVTLPVARPHCRACSPFLPLSSSSFSTPFSSPCSAVSACPHRRQRPPASHTSKHEHAPRLHLVTKIYLLNWATTPCLVSSALPPCRPLRRPLLLRPRPLRCPHLRDPQHHRALWRTTDRGSCIFSCQGTPSLAGSPSSLVLFLAFSSSSVPSFAFPASSAASAASLIVILRALRRVPKHKGARVRHSGAHTASAATRHRHELALLPPSSSSAPVSPSASRPPRPPPRPPPRRVLRVPKRRVRRRANSVNDVINGILGDVRGLRVPPGIRGDHGW